MRSSGLLVLAAVAVGSPMAAQTVYNPAVAKAMSASRWVKALCPLKNDFRTQSAVTYLYTADSVSDPDRKLALRKRAIDVTTTAITGGNATPAAWYYLGRADLLLGDVRGADTALAKAEALVPDCVPEIKSYRQIAWNVLVTPSSDLMTAKLYDSAVVMLRLANTISKDYPQGFYNLGAAFASMKQYDSAATYFKLAQEKSAKEPRFAKTGDDATYNLAFLYAQLGRYPEAITEYKAYIAGHPDDADAKKALAATMRLAGDSVGANQLQAQLATSGDLSAGELMGMGIDAYKAKDYAKAADLFQKVVAKEPGSHDALFNLANMYLAMNNGPKLVEAAKQCLAISPLGEDDIKLLAGGYRMSSDTADMLKAFGQLTSLTTAIVVTRMTPSQTGAKLTGTATGKDGQAANGSALPPTAVTLVFEFTDIKGAVVTSTEVSIPALQPGAKQDFSADATGAGIIAWRYHVK